MCQKEMNTRNQYLQTLFLDESALPFSFLYGGKEFSSFLGGSVKRVTESKKTEEGTLYSIKLKCGVTGLEVLCEALVYESFPAIDWTLHFKNTSRNDTPIISDIKTLDMKLPVEDRFIHHPILHHFIGSPCAKNDFEPRETYLSWRVPVEISTTGGRGSNGAMPYFNVEAHDIGLILAIGWPGQWSASFERFTKSRVEKKENYIDIKAGQSKTHFKLLPGEDLRAPRMVMLFYHGDYVCSQNMWRKWMREYNQPKVNGQKMEPQSSFCLSNSFESQITSAKDEIEILQAYKDRNITVKNWWLDAGWFPCNRWHETGTWEVDPVRFPHGIREVSEYCRSNGMKTIVWFEPERVRPGTWLYENKPEWITKIDGAQDGDALLWLGDPECLAWVLERFDEIIKENTIDIYRQDFNMEALPYWEAMDDEDRQGVAEIKHVTGYLALWDKLLERNPGMFIDTCASGGRRLDIETLKRSVSLLRSDYLFDDEANQGHTYGISFLIPFHGTGFYASYDEYSIRSLMIPELTIGADARREDLDYELLRGLKKEWEKISPLMLEGDYYPLTPYSVKDNAWMAWQFHCPDREEGFVQVFRRKNCPHDSARHKLSGLTADSVYLLENLDRGVFEAKGSELMDEGILIKTDISPKAVIICYRKKK